jgi:tetratricopeptide (TPR) repeat protein
MTSTRALFERLLPQWKGRTTWEAAQIFQLAARNTYYMCSTNLEPIHLLLGCLQEPEGMARTALLDMGLNQIALISNLPAVYTEPPEYTAPVVWSKGTQNALQYAQEEAIGEKAKHIETEHVLQGLLRVDDDGLHALLKSCGIGSIREARGRVLDALHKRRFPQRYAADSKSRRRGWWSRMTSAAMHTLGVEADPQPTHIDGASAGNPATYPDFRAEMIDALTLFISRYPQTVHARVQRAAHYTTIADGDGARADYKAVPEDKLPPHCRRLWLAHLNGIEGDYARAYAEVDAVLRSAPLEGMAYIVKAALLWTQNRLDEALEACYHRLQLDDKDPVGYMYRAYIHMALGDLQSAEEDHERINSLGESKSIYFETGAWLHFFKGEYDIASSFLQVPVRRYGASGGILYLQGKIYAAQDRPHEASTAFEQAIPYLQKSGMELDKQRVTEARDYVQRHLSA